MVVMIAGCGSTAPRDEPVAVEASGPPFSADVIRDATDEGRTYRYRVAGNDGRAEQVIRFSEVDLAGAMVETTVMNARGEAAGEPRRKRVTWDELERHAHFPPKTTRAEVACRTPAGAFACLVYTVRDAEGQTRFFFAKSLPGAPVRVTADRGGREVVVMELLEHRAGVPSSSR